MSTPEPKYYLTIALIWIIAVVLPNELFAGSAQWANAPASGDWNTDQNWTPTTVPNGSLDIATFSQSLTTSISISSAVEVNKIVFSSDASAYTFSVNSGPFLAMSGVGIENNSGVAEHFVTSVTSFQNAVIRFTNSASAGSSTVFTNNGSAANNFGVTEFRNSSTAGQATIFNNGAGASAGIEGFTVFYDVSTAGDSAIVNNASTNDGPGGQTLFNDSSNAGNADITNNGGNNSGPGVTQFTNTSSAGSATIINKAQLTGLNLDPGLTFFGGTSTAANATIISEGGSVSGARGGRLAFIASSTAGAATLIAQNGSNGGSGGTITFNNTSTGGTARVELIGNGSLDISNHSNAGVSVGSIEGGGNVFLGANPLTIGTNNLTTIFSGSIQNNGGEINGTGGSVTKTGTGTLTLTGSSTYNGGTTVNGGTLLVNNTTGSATGSGAIQVTVGTLGGTGTIAGAVTIGTGVDAGAVLSPGASIGTLTIQSALALNSDATFAFELNSATAAADKIIARGVTINGAAFSFSDLGNGHLSPGTTFVIIDNTSSTTVVGFFSNLADQSVFTNGGNSYRVSYEGGDGNDLTVTVVPEPATWELIGLGALLLFTIVHARRKNVQVLLASNHDAGC